MNAWLSQNSHSSTMTPFFQCPMVAIGSLNFLPVGAMVLPPAVGMGFEKVPSMMPMTVVHSP